MVNDIPEISTLFTIREETTDGHAPVVFHCSDGKNYFCKYRINTPPKEMDFLAFEIVASRLLKQLKIPTPDIAFVRIEENTLNRDIIKKNLRMQSGIRVFGSKELVPVSLITDLSDLQSKRDFNKLKNPEDIIRISIFDYWVKNSDRGRKLPDNEGHNFNLLFYVNNKKTEIIAFDHAFIFGNSYEIGNFAPSPPSSIQDNLSRTPFYRSVIKYIGKERFVSVVDNFITLLHHDYSEFISQTLSQLPLSWRITENLDERIIGLLHSKDRIESIRETIIQTKS